MLLQLFHSSSPLLYVLYVEYIRIIPPCPQNINMRIARYCHNSFMALISGLIFVMINIGNAQTDKFSSIDNLICKSYDNNWMAYTGAELFLWSKYLEWIDTLFLQLSGKPITELHYTHHMSTALLMYYNTTPTLTHSMYIFMGSNTFIHVFMYWYYADSYGWLYPYRQWITRGQILQHILCLITIYATNILGEEHCKENVYGNVFAFLLYHMYLVYFMVFYLKKYEKVA